MENKEIVAIFQASLRALDGGKALTQFYGNALDLFVANVQFARVLINSNSIGDFLSNARKYAPQQCEKFIKHYSDPSQTANTDILIKFARLTGYTAEEIDQKFFPTVQDDKRTQNMFACYDQIDETGHYTIGDETILCLTRDTRDFHEQKLIFVDDPTLPIILLDPEDDILQGCYTDLITQLDDVDRADPLAILSHVGEFTRTVFPAPIEVKDKKKLETDRNGMIKLSVFINIGQGICRHHTLLNCYLLSRLQADDFLNGEVIYHRATNIIVNNEQQGGHAWIVFKTNGDIYCLDSGNNECFSIGEQPDYTDELFGNGTAKILQKRYADNHSVRDNTSEETASTKAYSVSDNNHMVFFAKPRAEEKNEAGDEVASRNVPGR